MIFPLDKIQSLSTPFYYYDMELLNSTILAVKKQTEKHGYHMHYALKANSNYRFLEAMQQAGFGADCVSGNEVQ
ncbi:MAG: diaminopimelate decarboxylase, partial [Bacteroidetes bacterium]|nr:diaminopimelate decarboxylase [Bacteroidota bacterium]